MTYQEMKMVMRSKAALARGLVNLLKDDTEYMYIAADDFDIFTLSETIREARLTTQQLLDTLGDLERDVRIAKRDA